MPRLTLTDLGLKNISPTDRQLQYWDASLPCFGCRVSPRGTKTFNVMLGKERRLIKIGNYPDISLGQARKKAHDLIDGEKDPHHIPFATAKQYFIDRHLETLKPSTAREQTNAINRFAFDKQLSQVTLDDINRVLATMPRGSARTCYNVLRTFLNWCIANDYLDRTPLRKSPYKAHTRDRVLSNRRDTRHLAPEPLTRQLWANLALPTAERPEAQPNRLV